MILYLIFVLVYLFIINEVESFVCVCLWGGGVWVYVDVGGLDKRVNESVECMGV